jgi:Zn ribbon nucleic-acid-binding protein
MGDRTTTFNDCPKCGEKGTFECYEALSSLMKMDECTSCGYMVNYDFEETDHEVKIIRITPPLTNSHNPTLEQLDQAAHKANWEQAKVVYADEIAKEVVKARIDELKHNLSSPSGMRIKYYQKRLKEIERI